MILNGARRPARARRIDYEAPEQRAVAIWLDRLRLVWCHVPNGGARQARIGAELKRQGVKRGVPDILIFDPPPRMRGARLVAVELKPPKGRPSVVSPEQTAWIATLGDLGCLACVCHGFAEVRALTESLGYVATLPERSGRVLPWEHTTRPRRRKRG